MNKFDFIQELLETKKFTPNQKDRFIRLVSSELANLEAKDSKILADIQAIKDKIGFSEAPEMDAGEEKVLIESYVEAFLSQFKNFYLEPINYGTDPRNASLDEKIDVLSRVADGTSKDRRPLIEKINEKHDDLKSPKVVSVIDRIYFMVKQLEVYEGLYQHLGISKNTFIIPLDIAYDIVERHKKNKNKSEGKENVIEENEHVKNEVIDNLNELPKYYYPSSTYKFLFNYSQNRILKSTCHDIGNGELKTINKYCDTEQYDFSTHLKEIKEAYNLFEDKYFAPSFLKTRFRVYLTGKNYYQEPSKGWSEDSIKINWSSLALMQWSHENPGVPPNLNDALIEQLENTGFENFESFSSRISGAPVQSFTELVYHFKNSFHLRGDNSLRDIIERINKSNDWNENIDFIINDNSFPRNIMHFTDVDKLIQAYKSIIDLIIEVTDKHNLEEPKVKITANVNLDEFQLSIHHLNSIYKKEISNTLERTGQQYRNLIENQINGLCNLILRAEFESGEKAIINIWNGEERKAVPITDDNFNGVEHIFQFPKK